jgi:predicted SprT family Zn-dependent metalloprotease
MFLLILIKIIEHELTHACVFLSGNEQKQMGEEQFSAYYPSLQRIKLTEVWKYVVSMR